MRYLLLLSLIPFLVSCQKDSPLPTSCGEEPVPATTEEAVFLEVAFGSEFAEGPGRVRKWAEDVLIYLPNRNTLLETELESVLNELNTLSESTRLSTTEDSTAANFILFFGDKPTYVDDYAPEAADLIASNFGLFSITWNTRTYEITRATACVDTVRERDPDCLRHLLREELTQALGLANDHYDFDDSIFFGEYTCTPFYSELDRLIIANFLSREVRAGMCPEEVYEILF